MLPYHRVCNTPKLRQFMTPGARECAKARGMKMGRPPKLTPHQQRQAIKRGNRGEESLTDMGRSYNVSAATISR